MIHPAQASAEPNENGAAVTRLSTLLQTERRRVAVAESLTCGFIASMLGAGDDASEWLAGGVVAYAADVKFRVLGVDEGPVITAKCALQMAKGVAELLGAEITLGVTGCGGPKAEEGQAPGTVFIACLVDGTPIERRFDFTGEPDVVLDKTSRAALELLVEAAMAGLGRDG